MKQMLKLPGRLINGCDATLNDQSGHLLVPNVNISVCWALQEALLSDLQNAGHTKKLKTHGNYSRGAIHDVPEEAIIDDTYENCPSMQD